MAYIPNIENASIDKDVEKKWTLLTIGGNVNLCSLNGKQYTNSIKLKRNYNMQQCHPMHASERYNTTVLKGYLYPFIHSSIIQQSQNME